MEGYWLFLALLVSALLLGFLSVIFVLVWVLHYREGLAWDGRAAEFNWHPVLMITGFVFVQGIAIVVYRLPWTRKCSKFLMKLIHAGLNTIALTLAIISLVAVFDFHNTAKIPNMYSLHSWIGLIAVILYSLQLVLGFVVFLLPFAPIYLRAKIMPIHVYSGLFLFGTVIATVLMGITEKLIFALKAPAYKDSPEEAVFVNTLGVLVVVFGGIVLWIVTRPRWKRPLEIQQKSGGKREGNEEGATMKDCKDTEKSNLEFSREARKQNLNLDDAGQRSTM
ncbi:PREDICTED: cytochrome b reductase 1 [Gekko japonicus]|uniref:Plasma membrane ascorbate-dependent reductase CYBRD1 n=1 Tax=Gekko japonicus TaxID=146911 RepID=A0ABM1JMR6_GEKJA|nr:PREDICTED: cytochrome b reductase 1 [Gekko japonicus]